MTTPYTLTPSLITKGEICLKVPLLDDRGYESRGATLARALHGRYAPEMRCFYFTPCRAKKWELLYRAGFFARLTPKWSLCRFRHRSNVARGMELADAVAMASAITEALPHPKPAEIEMEIEV